MSTTSGKISAAHRKSKCTALKYTDRRVQFGTQPIFFFLFIIVWLCRAALTHNVQLGSVSRHSKRLIEKQIVKNRKLLWGFSGPACECISPSRNDIHARTSWHFLTSIAPMQIDEGGCGFEGTLLFHSRLCTKNKKKAAQLFILLYNRKIIKGALTCCSASP